MTILDYIGVCIFFGMVIIGVSIIFYDAFPSKKREQKKLEEKYEQDRNRVCPKCNSKNWHETDCTTDTEAYGLSFPPIYFHFYKCKDCEHHWFIPDNY
jgi:hypothetical protein